MKVNCCPKQCDYMSHYTRKIQQGSGINVIRGYNQHDSGILSFLGGLMKRTAVPLLKQVDRKAGTHALKAGVNLAQNTLRGRNVKQSLKKHSTQAIKGLIGDVVFKDSQKRKRRVVKQKKSKHPRIEQY